MSSTKRRSDERTMVTHRDADYYRTPVVEIQRFLRAFEKDYPGAFESASILDPAAGGDPEHPTMPYPVVLKERYPKATVTSVDVRPDSSADVKANYLEVSASHGAYNIIITNPPFVYCEQFLRKALTEVAPMGFVILLCRLNYFGSERRMMTLWSKGYMPERVYVHSRRMSFGVLNKKGTAEQSDSIEYMHAVWRPHLNLTGETKLTMLAGGSNE